MVNLLVASPIQHPICFLSVIVTTAIAGSRNGMRGTALLLLLREIIRAQQHGTTAHVGKPVPDGRMASAALHVVDRIGHECGPRVR